MHHEFLFPDPGPEAAEMLERFGKVLNRTFPLAQRHRKELPYKIRDLSRALTEDRDDIRKDYMGDPGTLSAYLRYFLPWNLFRLSRLFNGLNLDVPDGGCVIDLGSGPLTVPLALWMFRPHLREHKLDFICLDRTPKPMRQGLKLLQAIAGDDLPWKLSLVKGSLGTRIRRRADLLVAANAVNEMSLSGSDLSERADNLASSLVKITGPEGKILIVEPGTRKSGSVLSAMREGFLESGFSPMSPCPHNGQCPMPGMGDDRWCHFNFPAHYAPQHLKDLSQQARLSKVRASLSFLFVEPSTDERDETKIRTVSEPFELPEGKGVYACSDRGLVLVTVPRGREAPWPGSLMTLEWPESPGKDAKSGALILPMKEAKPEKSKRLEKTAKPTPPKKQEREPRARPKSRQPQKDRKKRGNR